MAPACLPRTPRPAGRPARPTAPAATALTGPGSDAVSRAVRGSIWSRPAALVTAQTAPAPAVRSTTGGSPPSTPGTVSARPVAGSTRRTSPPTASHTACRVTAMASTWELVATTLVTPDGPGGRLVARVGLVGAGEVGSGRVVATAVVLPSSRGRSHRPVTSRPARATTTTRAADTSRWDLARAVHLRAHLPPAGATSEPVDDVAVGFVSAAGRRRDGAGPGAR
jgi:hypothetical protein